MLAGRHELAEGALPEMVDEHVLRAPERVTGPAGPLRVVVVLEQPQLEALVQRAQAFERVPPHGQAEHRGHPDVEGPSPVLAGATPREAQELAPGVVVSLYLCLVSDPVRGGADEAHLRILEM